MKLLRLGFLPRCPDLAMLVLRLWVGFTLMFNHGVPKLLNFDAMATRFHDVIGLGHLPSLVLAIGAEVGCAFLVIIGLWTRLAALVIVVELGVVFVFAHHLKLTGPHNGELAFVYLAAFVAILLAGGGRYSVDRRRSGGS